MGSWLMTKEACASLASIITCREFDPPLSLVEKVGNLLISTLTTLKHQGAAFAAHRALQELANFCFNTSLDESFARFPLVWSKRLMSEISGIHKVRDSTLRRSTGYALAFLSIMRSESPSTVAPRILCPDILATLVRMSLPLEKQLKTHFQQLSLTIDSKELFHSTTAVPSTQFANAIQGEFSDQVRRASVRLMQVNCVSTDRHSYLVEKWRSRVHALNILRFAILDAPLASDTRPFISDAVISSLIAYNDSKWAVRNSATMVFASAMLRVVDADKNASSSGENAITATELFRTYPMLPKFLLHMMSKGVEDMEHEDSSSSKASMASSSRFLHPSLYPILLLLARLQPVAVSGENAVDVTEAFIPTVLLCIKHRNHKVRLVAARALANISSDETCRQSFVEALIKKCEDMLLISEQNQQDWNTTHGALLGIHHLLRKMLDPGLLLHRSDELRARLYRFVESAGDSFWCPPPCASIVLETLNNAAAQSSKGGTCFKEEVVQTSLMVVSKLNQFGQISPLAGRIGEARLGAVASRAFCDCGREQVWDPAMDFEKRELLLNSLSCLLENDMVDVRLEATKAFKKSICSEIDRLLAIIDVPNDAKRDTILRIALLLQTALMAELNRTESASSSAVVCIAGIHPPTVRRLSRCFLECCHALRALDFDLETNVETSEVLSARNMWEIAVKMMGLEEESGQSISLMDTDKPLNGNALELMAFAVHAWASSGNGPENGFIVTELRLFVQLLSHLNDVHASWRLRHSIVVAIETSRVLLFDTANDAVKASQLDLFSELLALLQDSDPDVRFVAGRAIMRTGCRENLCIKQSLSSQLLLERGYMVITERFIAGEMNARLLQSLVVSCRGIIDSLDSLEYEMSQSENAGSPRQLMNLGTDRKIFEDEVANPFEEVLLANQLRVVTAVKAFPPFPLEDTGQRELLELCSKVLGRLFARELANDNKNQAPDIAHELTRCSSIFPFIHSLLIGSTAAVYLGAEDSYDVRGDARSIISLRGAERESAVHPCVFQALGALATANPSDQNTQQDLLHCCFLLAARLD